MGKKEEKKKGIPIYKIAEGHGRFLYNVDGKKSLFLFAVADRKAGVGEPIAADVKEKIEPIFGLNIQNPEKARVIAKALEEMADEMEKEGLYRQWTKTAEDRLADAIRKETESD